MRIRTARRTATGRTRGIPAPIIAVMLAASGATAQTASLDDAVIVAQEQVRTGNGAAIWGGIGGGDIGFGNGTNINGPLRYVNHFDPGRGSRLSEAAQRVNAINPLATPDIPTDPGQGLGLRHGEDRAVQAGAFGNVDAGNGATLRLDPGSFALGGLDAGQNFSLVADTTAGDVTATFDGAFRARNGLSIRNEGPGVLRLVVRDGFEAGHGASIRAGVFAGGNIELDNGAFVEGGLFAGGSIEAGDGLHAVHGSALFEPVSVQVPGPSAAAAIGLGALLASRRRR